MTPDQRHLIVKLVTPPIPAFPTYEQTGAVTVLLEEFDALCLQIDRQTAFKQPTEALPSVHAALGTDGLTLDQRNEVLRRMRNTSNHFYTEAIQSGCHALIEFTGFINNYIRLCQIASEEGTDFTQTNKHSGKPLTAMHPGEAAYLGEKFGCIFATSFAKDQKNVAAFCLEAFGLVVEVKGDATNEH